MKGCVALVTGGASGLGKATVEMFVEEGAKVAIFDLPSSEGEKLAENFGESVIFIQGDVSSEIDVRSAVDQIKLKFHRLDFVVNCAGIYEMRSTYDFETRIPYPLDAFKRIVEVNTVGTFNVIRLSVGLMSENRPIDGQKGVIINTASIGGLDGISSLLAYVASNSAIIGLTLPLAREFGDQGIRVCCIAPGPMKTPMCPDEEFAKGVNPFPKRNGRPKEFAHLVKCLVENKMMNGEVVRLDGAARVQYPPVGW